MQSKYVKNDDKNTTKPLPSTAEEVAKKLIDKYRK